MRSRTGGMWWGTTIEAPDPSGLAKFHAELLDWHIGHEEPGTAVVAASPQGPFFVFQQADGYRAPVWPPADGDQRPMMHFDFQVGDLDSAVAEAVALGATVAEFQPRENVRVLFDPAGHPFLPVPRRRIDQATFVLLTNAWRRSSAACLFRQMM
ncbi:VOC family protein [Streptomyces sp. NPDC098077]|uniref:VOC family protein n=1 Tax=Streptomyces sp. NPDC098077 TaxID=3366093 RepID=UPI003800BC2D